MDLINIILIILCIVLLIYLRNGAIPLPTHKKSVDTMLELVDIKPGMKVVDLGSGDGRIVMAFAQAGAIADGYEINPVMVWWSRLKLLNQKNTKIMAQSFWTADLSEYDVVVVFGITHIMDRLSLKLQKELKPDAIVVSNIFKFSDWVPELEKDGIRLYRKQGIDGRS